MTTLIQINRVMLVPEGLYCTDCKFITASSGHHKAPSLCTAFNQGIYMTDGKPMKCEPCRHCPQTGAKVMRGVVS